jgi:hypothetical protein
MINKGAIPKKDIPDKQKLNDHWLEAVGHSAYKQG